MEFKSCPSCKASVLEDDAENCPFCGASMTGKPSPAPPRQSASDPAAEAPASPKSSGTGAGTAASGKSAARKPDPARKSRPAPGPAAGESDDPFEVDTRAMQKAHPVARKPAKGRMHRIVCPMCETPGFIALSQCGKEVKCCNPECLVPIFTAPAPEKPPEEEPDSKRGISGVAFGVVAVALIGAVGFGLWYFLIRGTGDGGNGDVTRVPLNGDVGPSVDPNGDGSDAEPVINGPPPVPPVSLAEVRATCLVEIVEVARQRQNNRSKPYGRRLSAESFVDVGQLDEAVAQIDAMRNVEGYQAFQEVEPWVHLALARLDDGDAAGANDALDEALAKADFRGSGRASLDAAGALAGGLVALERVDEAREVAGGNSDPSLRGRLSTLWRGAVDSGSFDVYLASERPDLSSMPNPQWVTVTRFLMWRGDVDAALNWAESADSVSVRENAVGVWAAELILNAPSPDHAGTIARIEEVAGRLAPAGRVRAWAAVSHAQQGRGDAAAAAASLERGIQAASGLTAPTETHPVPGLVEIYESDGRPRAGLPDQVEHVAKALALIDLAQLRAAAGDVEQAWDHVAAALGFLRAATPGPVATQSLVDECEGAANIAAVKRRLASALEIRDDQMVFLAFNQYRKQCAELNDQASRRFRVQVELLRRAVTWGMGEQVWEEIQSRSDSSDPNDREPFLETSLPGMIVAYSSDDQLVERISTTLAASRTRVSAGDQMELEFAAAIEADDVGRASAAIKSYWNQPSQDPYPLYLTALRGVSQLIAADRHGKAFDLAMEIPYPMAREDAYWLIGAAAMRDGRHSEIWRRDDLRRLSATEKASLYRGLIDGLQFAPPEPEPEPEPEEVAEVAHQTR